jgi:hypothetical protein
MSRVTPENKVKKRVKWLLDQYKPMYQYWPVPMGMGPSSLDCIVCYYGFFVAIETKAPGKKPTPRQEFCIDAIRAAYGSTFVVDDEASLEKLQEHLEWIKQRANNS